MLIININTLNTINLLNFTKHIILNSSYAKDSNDIMWVLWTFCDFFTLNNNLSFLNLNSCISWYRISFWVTLIISNYNICLLLCLRKANNTTEFCKNCKALWLSCLEKFLYSRKTLSNVITGNTTCMECSHSKLCTRLTDW